MTKFVQRVRQRVRGYAKKWKADASANRFMAFCRQKWPQPSGVKNDSVVLISYFPHKIATYHNAHLANYLAKQTGSAIEVFKVSRGIKAQLIEVYASFGAHVGLDASFAGDAVPELQKKAKEIFTGLKSKDQLLELYIGDLKVGDLIYDSFLRYHSEPTVILDDPRLLEIIFQTLLTYEATVNYLKARKVVAFIPDDYGYHECGVITRVMMRAGVPVYMSNYGSEFFLFRLVGEPETEDYNYPVRWPYHHYRELFDGMPADEQKLCREKGRQHLDRKLAGVRDKFTLVDRTAYGEVAKTRIFPENGKPRVLVLMHDFFDSPHGFRWMIFADFLEWLNFLFERASETDFEWYMKPHPSSWDADRESINQQNLATIEALRARFPKIHFLPPTVSNKQIVQEGISAMFTMYGTGGHEFAEMGIPVVNAADNPHINYDFNYHPRTADEYAGLIARADRLPINVNHDEISEYVYMNYFYLTDHMSKGPNPLPPEFYAAGDFEKVCDQPDGYDRLIFTEDPAREAEVEKYYADFLKEDLAALR